MARYKGNRRLPQHNPTMGTTDDDGSVNTGTTEELGKHMFSHDFVMIFDTLSGDWKGFLKSVPHTIC